MEDLTDEQQLLRNRVEVGIAVAAPFLDIVLAAGERLSRVVEPVDHEYYPLRSPEEMGSREGLKILGSGTEPE